MTLRAGFFRSRQYGRLFLGKLAARANAIKFKLPSYLDTKAIVVPPVYGHINNDLVWGDLGNTKAGCCVVAGAAHEIMLWSRAATSKMAKFSERTVLRQYQEASGWNGLPDDVSDTGLDMQAYASHRRRVGLLDDAGVAHKVMAYAACQTVDDVIKASYVFGAIGVGIQFPQSAADQFDRHQVWSPPLFRSPNLGGHYVPIVGRNSRGNLVCITWGRLQAMTPAFLAKYMDESVAYISSDYLNATQVTPRLFDLAKLKADLAAISAA